MVGRSEDVGEGEEVDDEAAAPLRRIDGAADEIRGLLSPARDRLEQVTELARGLADGTLPDAEAAAAARTVAEAQPTRRPR